jgi:F-type H+-transporting ATPase subunit a
MAGMFAILFLATPALAGGGVVNWYSEIHYLLGGGDAHSQERFVVIAGGVFVLLVTTVVGLLYKKSVVAASGDIVPEERFSLRSMIDMAMDLCVGMARDNLGKEWKTYITLLAGLFMFIAISNLGGLVPGFIPATENFSNNLAMGLIVFLIYNFAGLREHGIHYLKQFTGPMLFLAPLMLIIEVVGHLFRPVSLTLRLMGNIFADHLLVGIFTSSPPYVLLPSALMFFGLLVALVQSFVFTLLTTVYISMAVSHDH